MGRKDWLYWVGGGGRGKSSTSRREHTSGEMKEAVGCMCAVFQIFDLHNQFQLPLNQEESTTTSKGLEAPRNSLELDEPGLVKEQGTLDYFPVGMNKIKTCHERISSSSSPRISTTSCGGGSKSRIDDISSSEYSCSPGTKTPTLVARLMGLDLLPECTSSPSLSNYPQRKDKFLFDNISVGARSLPETPRVSASSARRSDVEHHRLSLQINNKENEKEEFGVSAKMVGSRRGGRLMRQQSYWSQDENRSPRDYAKQIVKQVKESVSKRVGLTDITNTNKNSRECYSRRDDNLVLLKPSERKKLISPSCSPGIRLLEANYRKKPVVKNSSTKSPRICETSCDIKNAKSELINVPLQEHRQRPKDIKKVIIGSGKLPPQATDHAIRNKKKEPSAKIKSSLAEKNKSITKTQLSATKLLKKQSHVPDALSSKRSGRLSSNPSRSYNSVEKIFAAADNNNNGGPTTPAAAVEYKTYIQRILKRAGKVTWQIDPSIFHYLELFHPINGGAAALSRRCNRKLIFQLVDELLSEIRRPHFRFRTLVCRNFDLPVVDELCKKISSFPAAKCTVLEDIDGLIAFDLSKGKGNGYLEEEVVEAIVCEIEGDLVAELVRDTAAVYGGDKG